jgi:hypothetical protein
MDHMAKHSGSKNPVCSGSVDSRAAFFRRPNAFSCILPRHGSVFLRGSSSVDESACNPKPKRLHRVAEILINGAHNDLANYNWAQASNKAGRPGGPRIRRQIRELIRTMTGFTVSDLAERVRAMSGNLIPPMVRAAYDIKKPRGKGMVLKIGASRRYEPLPEGLRAKTALGGAARTGNPTLARRQHSPRARLPTVQSDASDQHYENLRAGGRGLFTELGVAA